MGLKVEKSATWYKSGGGQEYEGGEQSQESIKIKYYKNAIRKMVIPDVTLK